MSHDLSAAPVLRPAIVSIWGQVHVSAPIPDFLHDLSASLHDLSVSLSVSDHLPGLPRSSTLQDLLAFAASHVHDSHSRSDDDSDGDSGSHGQRYTESFGFAFTESVSIAKPIGYTHSVGHAESISICKSVSYTHGVGHA